MKKTICHICCLTDNETKKSTNFLTKTYLDFSYQHIDPSRIRGKDKFPMLNKMLKKILKIKLFFKKYVKDD